MKRCLALAGVLHASIVVSWFRPAADRDGRVTLVKPVYTVRKW